MLGSPKKFLKSQPNKPGVYQMYDKSGKILYVGKAKDLKKRLSSYFRQLKEPKTALFMEQVDKIEIMVAASENEALLLENSLIKAKKPRYNVLFKDDKSYPYIVFSNHEFPRLVIYRGIVNSKLGEYFGPFPDASAASFVLKLVQKIFKLRVCKDSFMQHRSRPCMLHQIKLCSAPCKGFIGQELYNLQLGLARDFLLNRNDFLVKKLNQLMSEAAAKLDYEQAASYRDQITRIRRVQADQSVTKVKGDLDVIALMEKQGIIAITILFVRSSIIIGSKHFFPLENNELLNNQDILSAFLGYYYLQQADNIATPAKIFVNLALADRSRLSAVISEKFHHSVTITANLRGNNKKLLAMAEANAMNALEQRHKSTSRYSAGWIELGKILQFTNHLRRVECFDVSHTGGEEQVVSCVVFDQNGPKKTSYRRFKVKTESRGDDYSALRIAIFKRYSKLNDLPDVIIVDGGKGQLSVVVKVILELKINIIIMAIAKGVLRKPGLEEIYLYGQDEPMVLPANSPAFTLIQQLRDESHRFAIALNRSRMIKARSRSELENIPGISAYRRALLLNHFGGISELKRVGVGDLAKVKGIGNKLAKVIYEYLHRPQ